MYCQGVLVRRIRSNVSEGILFYSGYFPEAGMRSFPGVGYEITSGG